MPLILQAVSCTCMYMYNVILSASPSLPPSLPLSLSLPPSLPPSLPSSLPPSPSLPLSLPPSLFPSLPPSLSLPLHHFFSGTGLGTVCILHGVSTDPRRLRPSIVPMRFNGNIMNNTIPMTASCRGGREGGGRKRGREGKRERGREGEREEGREGGRERVYS